MSPEFGASKKVWPVHKIPLVFGNEKAYDECNEPQDIVGLERNGNK
jgi:hypothetical protein